ncbi:hypothetical protein JWG39_11185 [Desulforhopalus vacuolatus]|uniref:ATPase domain-containing protein n=1 Tax=Desulforhopalus vacuolatus TaxID=40414 RepID=UPI001964565F|nr:ATPase domain-containing protein [Desulforhopalus vacuolatus]MBM9520375.1 hypothetical protein [Desulforhopalus vacuolatus]
MKAARSQSIKENLPKVPTHIKGLDEILQGGLPENHVSLIVGGPGSGKSILGMQFLYNEAQEGNSGIFITFEEKAETIRHNSMLLGFDLTEVEENNTLYIMEAQLDPSVIISGEFDIEGLLVMVGALAKKMGATRIVVDAIDVLLQHFNDSYLERKSLYILHKWLLDHNMTAVMTVKTADHVNNVSHYQFLDYLTNCVIQLRSEVVNRVSTSLLRVVKYRGSDFSHNEFPYIIKPGGIFIHAIPSVKMQNTALGKIISSGHPTLDELLGGGYRQSSCVSDSRAPLKPSNSVVFKKSLRKHFRS